MKKTAFITGIAGFAGSYLAEELLEAGFTVSGSLLKDEPTTHIDHIINDLELVTMDILDADRCRKTLNKLKPARLFHLAAMASVGKSFEAERLTLDVNLGGTLNLLQAANDCKALKSFLFVGSADVYGIFKPTSKTLKEDQPLNPISPYGISKTAAEHACRYYHRAHHLPVVVVRAFNHTGPRQNNDFVVPSFARQIAAIEAGRQRPVLRHGDLSARRDLSDVRDIARGYRLAAVKGRPGEVYQLCSGKSVAVQKVLEILLSMSSLSIRETIDKSRLRKADIPLLRGSNRKATEHFGYEVRYSLKETLSDTLSYWRSRLGSPTTKKTR